MERDIYIGHKRRMHSWYEASHKQRPTVWSGRSWTEHTDCAQPYSLSEARALIAKRWADGVKYLIRYRRDQLAIPDERYRWKIAPVVLYRVIPPSGRYCRERFIEVVS